MDPNETLAELRQMFDDEIFTEGEWSPEVARQRLRAFAEAFGNLDDWLRGGGFLPDAWRKA
jgi:hypothetical protein